MPEKFRIVFMGTPDFAVPILNLLLQQENLVVVAVITAADKPGGRGRKQMIESAVKIAARNQGLTILQPRNLKSADFIETYRKLRPDLAVVVAFRMLPEVIWSAPRFGTINLHASLLPAYRGAAPINWAIINGEKETGLTTFRIAREIDTGSIVFQEKVAITDHDTAGTLHDKLMIRGAELVKKTVQVILSGNVIYLPQDDTQATLAPKIFTEDCEIIAHGRKVKDLANFVRGLSPFPGAWFRIDDVIVKVYKVSHMITSIQYPVGSIVSDGKTYLRINGIDGYLQIEELQMQGKKRMDIKSFLNGFDVRKSMAITLEVG